MGAFSAAAVVATQFPEQSPLQSQRRAFSIKARTRICFSQRLLFFRMKSADFRVDGLHNLIVVSATTLTAQKEETVVPEAASTVEKEVVKNVLTLFLRKQGLTNAAATRTISKSDRFVNHLVSRLHAIDKTRYLVGSELPILALEIRDALVPYLESLLEEHGDILVDEVENFPNSPNKREMCLSGNLPSLTLYLLNIGMDLDQIKEVSRKYPSFVNLSLGEQIKPAVEFLLDLGMPQSDIPSFLCSAPYCCDSNLSDTTKPTFLYLENLGFDKGQLLKMLKRCPRIFKCERHKVKGIVDFLQEIGLSTKDIVKVISTKCPQIITYSVDNNRLWPIAEYFHSIGVNVPYLFFRFPMVFRRSVEQDIKPITEFLLDKGYSMEEIRTMAMTDGGFYLLKVNEGLIAKWDFFLTMGYPRSELVKFPRYLSYSLEGRIKPRYERMMERGVKLELIDMLRTNDSTFEKRLNRRMKKIKA